MRSLLGGLWGYFGVLWGTLGYSGAAVMYGGLGKERKHVQHGVASGRAGGRTAVCRQFPIANVRTLRHSAVALPPPQMQFNAMLFPTVSSATRAACLVHSRRTFGTHPRACVCRPTGGSARLAFFAPISSPGNSGEFPLGFGSFAWFRQGVALRYTTLAHAQ